MASLCGQFELLIHTVCAAGSSRGVPPPAAARLTIAQVSISRSVSVKMIMHPSYRAMPDLVPAFFVLYRYIPKQYNCAYPLDVADIPPDQQPVGLPAPVSISGHSFPYPTKVFKVSNTGDGHVYALRRVDKLRTTSEVCSDFPLLRFLRGSADSPMLLLLPDCEYGIPKVEESFTPRNCCPPPNLYAKSRNILCAR